MPDSESKPSETSEPKKSSSKESQPSESPQRASRVPARVLNVVQLLVAGFIVIAANYLSSQNHHAKDLTRNNDFTLSSLTKNLLKSELISDRKTPVKIILVAQKTSPHYSRLRLITEEYERAANGTLTVELVDPIRDTDRAQEISDFYDSYIILEDFFIVDATPAPPEPAGTEEGTAKAEAPTPNRNHIRYVPVEEMLVFRNDQKSGVRELIGYRDEDSLSAAILAAVEGKPRRIYFLADKSQLQDASDNSPWSVLSDNLRRQNITLAAVKIADLEKIPADAEGVALVAPEYDLNEREMEILEEYWDRPRSALLVLLDPAYRPRNLQSFLRKHGVRMRNDRIITVSKGRRISDVTCTFTFGHALNEINTQLRGEGTTFEGSVASLEVEENADRLLNRRILPVPLIEASPRFWGETRYQEEAPDFDPSEDTGPPLYLAAAVTRGNATGEDTANDTSRMVVVSTVDFLDPRNQYLEQIDFLSNSAHWLINREELMGVGPQPIQKYKLNLVPDQVAFVDRFNLFIIPGLFLFFALMVVKARRV